MIELDNVSFMYENAARPALTNITFTIEEGEMLAIVGHNGSGKSTLAKQLNGLLLPTQGRVLVDGMDTSSQALLLKIRERVGMVFQNPDNQLVTTIVEEDVAFGPESLGIPSLQIRERVDEALLAVGMSAYKLHAPHMLSGGQKQRVAIAGMLAMRPKVLVLDEATSMLDPEGRRDILEIVGRLNAELKMTVVLITQLMEEAAMCNRIAVLSQGELLRLAAPAAVFREEDLLFNAGLDVPEMVRLRSNLEKNGIFLEGEPLTITEFADAVANKFNAKKKPQ